MRLPGLFAALLLAFALACRAVEGAERAQPGLRRDQRRAIAVRAGRARDLDVRDRLQRPLLHLHLSAAARRGDRLVRHPAAPTGATSCSRPGARSRTRLLRAGRPGLPGALARPRPTASSGARATTRCCRSSGATATATRPATSRTRRSTPRRRRRGRPAAERLRSPFRHLDRRARAAQVPEPALRRRRLGDDRRLGGLRRLPLRRSRRPRQPAATGSGTARSSRRSASAWPAAPATSPTIR